MGRVFIVQEPMKRSASGEMVSVMDFRKALVYGELTVCLENGSNTLSTAPVVHALKDKLRNFSDQDYLICAGDPSAIAIAGAIACNNNLGKMKILKWDRNSKKYIEVSVNIFNRREE